MWWNWVKMWKVASMVFFRTNPLEIDGYKQCRKHFTREDICYLSAEANRNQECLIIVHVIYIMFWRKLTIRSLACLYHIQRFSGRATSIVWSDLYSRIMNFFTTSANIFIFSVRFFFFLLKCGGWLTLESDLLLFWGIFFNLLLFSLTGSCSPRLLSSLLMRPVFVLPLGVSGQESTAVQGDCCFRWDLKKIWTRV